VSGKFESGNLKPATSTATPEARSPQALPVVCVCVFLVLAVLAVFWQTAHFQFINCDDQRYVYENSKFGGGLSMGSVVRAFTHAECGLYHPLTMISLMVDYDFHGVQAGGYHLTNVLVHALSGVVLFLILRRMTGALWRSAFVAAVFAIHPLRVESVAWVAERKDVLGAFFFLLTVGAYVRYVRDPSSRGRYWTVAGLFVLGLLSKPTAVTLPFVLLLLDYWPLGRMGGMKNLEFRMQNGENKERKADGREEESEGFPFWGLVREKMLLFALAAAACVVTVFAARQGGGPTASLPVSARVGNALVSYVVYLRQTVWPARLAAFYPYPRNSRPLWEIALAVLLLAGISGGALALRRSRPWLVVGWLWYLGTLVPMIGLIPSGDFAHADRNTYLPQIGVCVMLTWALAGMSEGWRHRRWIQGGVSTAVLGLLMLCARQQTSFWRESESLWRHTLSRTSGNLFALNNLGGVLEQKGELDKAIEQYGKALEIKPDDAESRNNLGTALAQEGKLEEAVAQYQKVLEANPDYEYARNNLAVALARKGNLEEAIAQYRKVLETHPNSEDARNNLGAALAQKGNLEEAVLQYRKAVELNPDYAQARRNLGNALSAQGDLEGAAAQLRKALELNPDHLGTLLDLGNVLLQKGDLDGAMAILQKATAATPELLQAWYNLGNAFLQSGELDHAIACYRHVEKINPRSADARANLGVAFLLKGETQEARDAWQKALEIKPDQLYVLNNLAWLLATTQDAALRDGAKAVALAKEAGQLGGDENPALPRTLAAAYAETGNYGLAAATARRGLELAVEQKNDKLAATLQKEIQLYGAGKPVRESAAQASQMEQQKEAAQRGEPAAPDAPRQAGN
jgi:tetratricopeptide (TPR) repeat protein